MTKAREPDQEAAALRRRFRRSSARTSRWRRRGKINRAIRRVAPIAVVTAGLAVGAVLTAPQTIRGMLQEAAAFLDSAFSRPRDLAGVVVDGDTIRIQGERVRLWGFDAAELPQRCRIQGVDRRIGVEAATHLSGILANGDLRCKTRARDDFGRPVAECWVGPVDIGDAMVRSGWAWAVPHFSGDRYQAAQVDAKLAGRGIWAGQGVCELPSRFRHR